MRISIYELLGLIKEGKAPKKIDIRGNIFESYSCSSIECYYRSFTGTNWLDDMDIKLDDEVEIIEEKEIRKLPNEIQQPRNFEEVVYIAEDLVRKINELIDVINDMRDKE